MKNIKIEICFDGTTTIHNARTQEEATKICNEAYTHKLSLAGCKFSDIYGSACKHTNGDRPYGGHLLKRKADKYIKALHSMPLKISVTHEITYDKT